jgi:hypothetical protein
MQKFIRRDEGKHRGWAVSVIFLLMIACLLGFMASYPKGASWISDAAQAEFADPSALTSEPNLQAKKPIRYKAVIENWNRYRAGKPDD